MKKYKTIVADPPWDQKNMNKWKRREKTPENLPYPTMNLEDIKSLEIQKFSDENSMCFIWTTNQFLPKTFEVLNAWGFKYLTTLTWVKPSGVGAWFINRTQHIIVGYKGKLELKKRFEPSVYFHNSLKHSQKPDIFHELFEKVSHEPRLELFARNKRKGWDVWGNEVVSDIKM
jgi:N6-adenosine-specific RNA methylase IME4